MKLKKSVIGFMILIMFNHMSISQVVPANQINTEFCVKEFSIQYDNIKKISLFGINHKDRPGQMDYEKLIDTNAKNLIYLALYRKGSVVRRSPYQIRKILIENTFLNHPEYLSQKIEFEYCSFFMEFIIDPSSDINLYIRLCKEVSIQNIDHNYEPILPKMNYRLDNQVLEEINLKIETHQEHLDKFVIKRSIIEHAIEQSKQDNARSCIND